MNVRHFRSSVKKVYSFYDTVDEKIELIRLYHQRNICLFRRKKLFVKTSDYPAWNIRKSMNPLEPGSVSGKCTNGGMAAHIPIFVESEIRELSRRPEGPTGPVVET